MPIYEYQCKNCSHRLEVIQSINDEPLTKCPECGKVKLERLISAPAFHLKGTGWYATDFKNPAKKENKEGAKEGAETKPANNNAPKESVNQEKVKEGTTTSGSATTNI